MSRRSKKNGETLLIFIAIIFFPITILIFILNAVIKSRTTRVREFKADENNKVTIVNADTLETQSPEIVAPTYKLKTKTITNTERYYLNIIRKAFGEDYEIRFQVPLSSIIEKEKNFKNEYQSELNRIVDIGLFDLDTTEPLLLIEINDDTHYWKNRQERDARVKSICDNAGIELLTFWTDRNNDEYNIVKSIKEALER